MTYLSEVTADAPYTYLRLEETTGAFVNSGSNSGQGAVNNGTAAATGRGAAGIDGSKAVNFTGTSTSWVSAPTNNTFLTDNRASVEAWVKTSQAAGVDRPIAVYGPGSRGFRMGIDTTSKPYVEWTTSNGTTRLTGTTAINNGLFHHIVGVADAGVAYLYVDGVAVTTNASPAFGTQSSVADYTYIGGLQASGGFIGIIDEVAVYDQALSPTRINAHYMASGTVAIPVTFTAAASTVSVAMPTANLSLGRTVATTPMTVSVAMTTPVVVMPRVVKPTVMTASVAMPDATAKGNLRTYFPAESIANEGGVVAFYETVNLGNIAPYSIGTAKWRVYSSRVTGAFTVSARNNDGSYSEAQTFDYLASFVGMSGTNYVYELDVTQFAQEMQSGVRNASVFRLTSSTGMYAVADGPTVQPRLFVTVNQELPVSASVSASNAMSINVGTISPNVNTSGSTTLTDAPMGISVAMPAVVIPNRTLKAGLMDIWVTAPEAQGIAGHDIHVTADEVMSSQVEILGDISVSNQTDRVIKATAMGITNQFVGIYFKESDRYYKRLTNMLFVEDPDVYTDAINDIWYDFRDHKIPADVVGTPEHTDGYKQRGGVFLSGDDEFISNIVGQRVGLNNVVTGQVQAGYNGIEMSIKTTAKDGVIFAGKNNAYNLEIEDGFLTIATWDAKPANGNTKTSWSRVKTKVSVSDGEWHLLAYQPHAIYVDGKRAWTRSYDNWVNSGWSGVRTIGALAPMETVYGGAGNAITPVMPDNMPRTPMLVAEVGDVILFAATSLTPDIAKKNYYEWSDSTIVNTEPIRGITAKFGTDTRGKGNTPRALILYGLGVATADGKNNTFIGDNLTQFYGSGNIVQDLSGYKAFSVHILDRKKSADGIVKQVGSTRGQNESFFYDDETGEIRFINLQEDLAEPVENFDAIFFVNWPGQTLGADALSNTFVPYFDPAGTEVNSFRNEAYFDKQREMMTDSIRDAVDKGLALYIGDPRMALDFGIASGYDVHDTPLDLASGHAQQRDYDMTRGEFPNVPAEWTGINLDGNKKPLGKYLDLDSINMRRIVSTATDFSEFPTFYVSEAIYYTKEDRLDPYADIMAWNVEELPDGLTIGSEFPLSTGMNVSASAHLFIETRKIISLRPEGIVGQVIAKEQSRYYRNAELVENPYADNITTVLVERGTMLKGKPTGGRIFVETMDNGNYLAPVRHADKSKEFWKGVNAPTDMGYIGWKYVNTPKPTPTKPYRTVVEQVPADAEYDPITRKWLSPTYPEIGGTNWDYDTRRIKAYSSQVRATSSEGSHDRTYTWSWGGHTSTARIQNMTTSVYLTYTIWDDSGLETEHLPLITFKDRGINWMQQRPWNEEPGAVRVRAYTMDVNVEVEQPELAIETDAIVRVEPMTSKVRLVIPPDYTGGDVEIDVDLLVLGIVYMPQPQKRIYVEPITANVVMKDPHDSSSAEGGFTFYLRDESITLYLGDEK